MGKGEKMKNCLVCAVLFALCPLLLLAQPDTLWTKTYGGEDYDVGMSVQQTTDGGYIIAGTTRSFGGGSMEVWLIKTNPNGDTVWTKTYGGTQYEEARSVQPTVDGGYVIAGRTQSYGWGDHDVWLLKTNANGDTTWAKRYGGYWDDYAFSVQQTTDGGYIVAGATQPSGNVFDVYLVKTDADGDTMWTRIYGWPNHDYGYSVRQTIDGGYVITGYATFADSRALLLRTDANGDTLWTKFYHDKSSGHAVQQTADGGYIVVGTAVTDSTYWDDVYLLKADANGDTMWTKRYGGYRSDSGRSVQQTADSGYIVTGYFGAVNGRDVWLLRTDANGDTFWTTTYGGYSLDDGYEVGLTDDGGYIIAGVTYSFGTAGSGDVWLLKTAPDIGIEEHRTPVVSNTWTAATIIQGPLLLPEGKECRVFDIAGRIVTPDKVRPGIYFIEVEGTITQKVVKIK